MPVTRNDLKELQGQLLAVRSSEAVLVRQEVTDALTSFAERDRDQDSLHILVGRAEAAIFQANEAKKVAAFQADPRGVEIAS